MANSSRPRNKNKVLNFQEAKRLTTFASAHDLITFAARVGWDLPANGLNDSFFNLVPNQSFTCAPFISKEQMAMMN